VHRYQGDTFYGGAQWILLACAAKAQGDTALAEGLVAWIEASATDKGHLPEQVADDVQSPHMLRYWRQRWGHTATPLLWSHAMHLVLLDDLGRLSTH
jgi:GH15 family glucan-1,4-alpha-glucosidase